MNDLYKFYIVNGETSTQVSPLDYPVLGWSKDGEVYKKEDFDIELTGDDYDTIINIGSCSDARLSVVRQADMLEQFNGKIYIKSKNEKLKTIKLTAKETDDKDSVESNSDISINIFDSYSTLVSEIEVSGYCEILSDNVYYSAQLTNVTSDNEVFKITLGDRLEILQPVRSFIVNGLFQYIANHKYSIRLYSAEGVEIERAGIDIDLTIDRDYILAGSYIIFYSLDEYITLDDINIDISASANTSDITVDSVILQSGTAFANAAAYRKFASVITIDSSDYDIYFSYVSRVNRGLGWTEINGLYYYPYSSTAPTPVFSSEISSVAVPNSEFYCGTNLAGTYYVTTPISDIEFAENLSTSFSLNGTEYTNGVNLRSVINQSLQLVDPSLYCVSSFLFDDPTETTSTWTNAETGGFTLGTLLMFKAYDIKNPLSTRSIVATTTLSEILQMLKFFNCYSFIDDDGFYRIEHISYKDSSSIIDLRTVETQRGQYCVWPEQEVEYSTGTSEGVILLKPSVPTNTGYVASSFRQASLVYQGGCADINNVKTIQMNGFIFDYNQVIAKDDDISDSSIVIISRNELGYPSNFLSPQNAAYYYYRHQANQQYYNIPAFDVENREALTLVRDVSVEAINYPELNSLFDIKNLYRTHYDDGNKIGEVESANINTKTGNVELNLLFSKI